MDDHQGGRMNRDNCNDKINELLKPFHVEYDGDDTGCKKIVSEDFLIYWLAQIKKVAGKEWI